MIVYRFVVVVGFCGGGGGEGGTWGTLLRLAGNGKTLLLRFAALHADVKIRRKGNIYLLVPIGDVRGVR